MQTMKRLWTLLGVLTLVALAGPAWSQSPYWAVDEDQLVCLIGGSTVDTVGDAHYQSWWRGWQAWVDFWWSRYDMDVGDWDNGFGYENVDDCNRPLCRTFNALMLLYQSDPNPVTSTSDYSGSILHFGPNFADSNIDELDGRCQEGRHLARTQRPWTPIGDAWTRLYPLFFDTLWPVERAASLLHEARHAEGGYEHVSGCAGGGSCDPSWGYQGANVFEVAYLWWFWYEARATPAGQKARAKSTGNIILDNGFVERPPYTITCGSPEEPC